MATWSKQETLKFIAVWGEEDIQLQLEGCKKTNRFLRRFQRTRRRMPIKEHYNNVGKRKKRDKQDQR